MKYSHKEQQVFFENQVHIDGIHFFKVKKTGEVVYSGLSTPVELHNGIWETYYPDEGFFKKYETNINTAAINKINKLERLQLVEYLWWHSQTFREKCEDLSEECKEICLEANSQE